LAFEPREIDRATKPGSRSDSEGEYDTDCTEDWCDDEDEDDDVIVEDTHAVSMLEEASHRLSKGDVKHAIAADHSIRPPIGNFSVPPSGQMSIES